MAVYLPLSACFGGRTSSAERRFLEDILEEADMAFIQEGLNEIYHHKDARKFLSPLSEEEEQTIKSDAYKLLNTLLRKERAK